MTLYQTTTTTCCSTTTNNPLFSKTIKTIITKPTNASSPADLYFSATREIQNDYNTAQQQQNYFLRNSGNMTNFQDCHLIGNGNNSAFFDPFHYNTYQFDNKNFATGGGSTLLQQQQIPYYYATNNYSTWQQQQTTNAFYNELKIANDNFFQPFDTQQQSATGASFWPYNEQKIVPDATVANATTHSQNLSLPTINQFDGKNFAPGSSESKNFATPSIDGIIFETGSKEEKNFVTNGNDGNFLSLFTTTNSKNNKKTNNGMACKIENCNCDNLLNLPHNNSKTTKSIADSTTTIELKSKQIFDSSLIRQFTCITCKKQFCRKSTLKMHIKQHIGDRPFVCQVNILFIVYTTNILYLFNINYDYKFLGW